MSNNNPLSMLSNNNPLSMFLNIVMPWCFGCIVQALLKISEIYGPEIESFLIFEISDPKKVPSNKRI